MKTIEQWSLALVLLKFPLPTAMQTDDGASDLDYSLALYILIGITVLYSSITLICIALVTYNCLCKKVQPRRNGVQYKDFRHSYVATPLETIIEESEYSSQSSLPQKGGLTFPNKAALEPVENDRVCETEMKDDQDEINDGSFCITNRTALELTSDNEEESNIPATFNSVLPVGRINSSIRRTKSMTKKHYESFLTNYSPHGSLVPPNEIKVPFSGQESQNVGVEDSNTDKLTAETLMKELEPVSKKWYIIGLKLNCPNVRLCIIRNEHNNSQKICLSNLCEEYVTRNKDASWTDVVEALRSDLVDEESLAAKLEVKYLSPLRTYI